MDDSALLRYSRHILLDEIGIAGQERLQASHALLIGAGGLGSAAALYLSSSGVGRITIVDFDSVDLSNLQRQVIHDQTSVGLNKAESAKARLAQLNPLCQVQAIPTRADAALLATLLPSVDVVLDGSDNFATRQRVNAACVEHAVPLVSASAIRFDGQISVFDSRQATSPCYACVFPPEPAPEETRCAELGVFAPLVGIIGCLQAAEALKVLAQIGQPLVASLMLFNALHHEWTTLKIARNATCSVCQNRPTLASHSD